MPVVTLPDGSKREFDHPVTVRQVAESIGAGLARAALAARVDRKLVDTSFTVDRDAELAIITDRSEEALEVIRHSTAHLLAQAVKQLFPSAQVTIPALPFEVATVDGAALASASLRGKAVLLFFWSTWSYPSWKRIDELKPEDWYLAIDKNLTSQFYCLQAVLPVMLAQGNGKIILLSSISAQRGSPSGDIAYSATKAGVMAIVKTLALYYAKNGILVNGIAPGIIDPGITDELPLERKAEIVKTIPLGRLGTTEEVGEMIAFLASDRAYSSASLDCSNPSA